MSSLSSSCLRWSVRHFLVSILTRGGAHIAVIATSFCVGTIIDSCIEILYNRFCIERSSKMRFLGDFGGRGEGIWRESISVLRIAHFQTSFVQI